MSDDSSIVAGSPGERATVADLFLNIADDSTFWKLVDGKDIADCESSFLAAVDKSAGMHSLGSNEGLLTKLVPVRVTENDACERGTTYSTSA